MAQKKKAPVGPKSAAKPAVRKAVPLKVAAGAQKSAKQTVKSKLEVAPKPSLAKAKVAQPAAAVKSLKKPPHRVVAKGADKTGPATAAKKPAAATHLADEGGTCAAARNGGSGRST